MTTNNNRVNQKIYTIITGKVLGFFRLTKALFSKKITIKQFALTIYEQIFEKPKLGDDFNWGRYHLHYEQELVATSKFHCLLPRAGDFQFTDGKLLKIAPIKLDLHPNHQLLYEIILGLNPGAVLEAGCGGGDHLRNLTLFDKNINAYGVDRSVDQIALLKKRHPDLLAQIIVSDITKVDIDLPKVDLVYTQAVLMHISELNDRIKVAVTNLLNASAMHLILIENWTQHNFMQILREAISKNSNWKNSYMYFVISEIDPTIRALVLSKAELPYDPLTDYELLLQGDQLRTH